MTKNDLEVKIKTIAISKPSIITSENQLSSNEDNNCCSSDSICSEDSSCESSICEGYSDIINLTFAINKKFEKIQEQYVLTRTQILVLQELWKKDLAQLKALADASGSSRANITGVINTMEKNGFVTREKNSKDGRSYLIKLTKKGQELQNDLPSINTMMNDCCKGITQDEITILKMLLKKFHDSLP